MAKASVVPVRGVKPGDGGVKPDNGGVQPGDGGKKPGPDGVQAKARISRKKK